MHAHQQDIVVNALGNANNGDVDASSTAFLVDGVGCLSYSHASVIVTRFDQPGRCCQTRQSQRHVGHPPFGRYNLSSIVQLLAW